MLEAAKRLEFEKAATLRDQIAELQSMPEYGAGHREAEQGPRAPKPSQARPARGRE